MMAVQRLFAKSYNIIHVSFTIFQDLVAFSIAFHFLTRQIFPRRYDQCKWMFCSSLLVMSEEEGVSLWHNAP